MFDRDFHDSLNDFQARPRTRRWWPKFMAIFMVVGGVYGATIGAAIITTVGAAEVIGIAAVVMAVLCGVPGARFGFFFGVLNRSRFAQLFLGVLATMGGAVLGGLLGLVLAMPLGAICQWRPGRVPVSRRRRRELRVT
jgi:hypothetical protein